jgi:dienelactone hydrolase
MSIKERLVEYEVDGVTLEALMAWDDTVAGPAPGVAIAHAWGGRGDFECDKARELAGQGYVGFALDVYGKGVRGNSVEENTALMTPLLEDRALLQRRLQAGVQAMREQAEVDAPMTAAIGYCFGGLCALDLARAGSDLKGVVSLHGLFNPPPATGGPISAKVLCLHGYDDPMVPPEMVLALASELSAAGADWQLHAYGNTKHAFTNPAANDEELGTVFNANAARRANEALDNFLSELFAAA